MQRIALSRREIGIIHPEKVQNSILDIVQDNFCRDSNCDVRILAAFSAHKSFFVMAHIIDDQKRPAKALAIDFVSHGSQLAYLE
jgi:hypothetical protein